MKIIHNILDVTKKLLEIAVLTMFVYGLYWIGVNKHRLIEIMFGV
tara:strand:- start:569 stop:703 length:135 start_codon:yes stop_codon:yes gene_type:complete